MTIAIALSRSTSRSTTTAIDCSTWRSWFGPPAGGVDQPRVALEHRACALCDRAQRRAPVAEDLAGHEQLGRDRVGHELDELVLVAHVVVERHRSHAQIGGDPAHRDRVEPVLVGDPQRGLHDRVRVEALARAAAGAAAHTTLGAAVPALLRALQALAPTCVVVVA